jgi:peptidyl-prolyl cis-trans isomerase SurA
MRILILAFSLILTAAFVHAQGLFSPAVIVNDDVITGYELDQREKLLRALRTPGNLTDLAQEQLIEERLKVRLTRQTGIALTEEGAAAGMSEFAGRANLTLDQFLEVLAQSGVERETLRDLVVNGLTWREYIRSRYGNRAQITDAEIDRAVSTTGGRSGIRVLVSEIIMDARPQVAAAAQARAERISQLRSADAFSAQARQVSLLPTKNRGGRLEWMPLSELPPSLQPLLLGLAPGEVTPPLPIPNAIALFQLRAIEETGVVAPEYSAIEYAAYYMPGGRSEQTLRAADRLRDRVDTCDDLYGVNRGQPDEQLQRDALPPADIPQDVAFELSKLDPGEISTVLTRFNGETLVFLMLCGRTPLLGDGGEVNREAVRNQLRSRRLNGYAVSLLAELRADARITFP